MERYLRAYRDPSSPLTPLTPFDKNPTFIFDFDVDRTPSKSLSNFKQSAQNAGTPRSSIELLNNNTESQKVHTQKQGRFSEKFDKLRKVFEPDPICKLQITNVDGEIDENVEQYDTNVRITSLPLTKSQRKYASFENLEINVKNHIKNQMGKKFIKASPVGTKALSPRTSSLLAGSGLSKYKSLFQREEIDLFVFRTLTFEELGDLGIEDMEERLQILAAAKMSTFIF